MLSYLRKFFLTLLIAGPLSGLYGQSQPAQKRTYQIPFIQQEIKVDGVLDEESWKTAETIGDLVQRQPKPGEPPTEKTDIKLLHDSDYLYVGVVAYDSEPDKIIGTEMARDGNIWSDDHFEMLLDTFLDQRNAYYFATNPTGALVDGLLLPNELQVNTNWDAIWDLRTQRIEDAWVIEIAIPFKSLSFSPSNPEWGFNLKRAVYRKLEQDLWTNARLETNFYQMSEAGKIEFNGPLHQGVGLDVRPFLASSWSHAKSTGENEFDFEPGVDVFWNITSSLKFTGTINTDFGETEVDARQINLDRFSLFFPEKRSFFLEDIAVFDFASTGPRPPGGIPSAGADVYPFFSRRIGLLNGEEVPLDIGLKLTGKVANTEIGVLGVRTGSTVLNEDTPDAMDVDSNNFIVGRIKQRIFEQSYIGAIFTDGHSNPERSSSTFGADLRLQTSDFLGEGKNFEFDAYAVKSENDNSSGDDMSFGFAARYPNDRWDGMVVFRQIEENFDPGIGFVQRKNVRMYRVAGSFNPRPRDFLNIQQMFHDVYYTQFDRLDNGMKESSELYITPLDWHFNSGDSLHALIDYQRGYERLFEPFQISPGVILPVGEYKTNRSKIVIATANKRPLSGSLNVSYGDFWSGSSEQVNVSLTYKLPPQVTASVSANQTFAHLPEGDFIARIFTGTLNFAISPRLTFSNLIQYDNRSRNLGWQSRMRWTLRPGNDLFISFNQGWLSDPDSSLRFVAQDTKIAAKFQYTFRF